MFDINKLEKVCPECNGEKIIYSLAWQKYFKEMKKSEEYLKIKFNKLIKEGKYDKNEYYVFVEKEIPPPQEPEEYSCPKCEGKGTVLTDEGVRLIGFIRKYW